MGRGLIMNHVHWPFSISCHCTGSDLDMLKCGSDSGASGLAYFHIMMVEKKLYDGEYIWRESTTEVIANGVADRSLLVTSNGGHVGERCQVSLLDLHQHSWPLPSSIKSPHGDDFHREGDDVDT
jgi:hypothetical protein